MIVALIALFIALGGVGYAALDKNSVGSKQVIDNSLKGKDLKDGKVTAADLGDNSVGAGEIADNAVGAGEVADNAVGAGEVADNAIGSGEIADNAVGSGEMADNAVGTAEVTDGSLTFQDLSGVPQIGAFARVATDGTLQPDVPGFPPQVRNITAGQLVKGEGGAATGTYCFALDFQPVSVLVSLDNADAAAANRNLVASVALDRGVDLGDCPPSHNTARVRIVDGNTEAATDARFFVQFLR